MKAGGKEGLFSVRKGRERTGEEEKVKKRGMCFFLIVKRGNEGEKLGRVRRTGRKQRKEGLSSTSGKGESERRR